MKRGVRRAGSPNKGYSMIGVNLKCRVVMLVAMIVSSNAGGQGTSNEPKDKKMITVRAHDIPQTVQIIGRLGQPLGSLLTIGGKWIRPGIQAKDRSLVFHVNLVNGREPNENIDLHSLQVRAILPHHQGGRRSKPGESWDWRFDWGGSEPSPMPVEGEACEMLGVETGSFDSYSGDAWREIGSPIPQTPRCMEGFVTRFEYIAVRKLR